MVKVRKIGKMGQALRGRVCPDPRYLRILRENGGWLSAHEVAEKVGHSWYIVAHALQRLTEDGMLEADVIEVAGVKRIREHSRVYRARPVDGGVRVIETALPGWLQPRTVADVGVIRQVKGVAGIGRWTQDADGPNGIPQAPENGAASTKSSAATALADPDDE